MQLAHHLGGMTVSELMTRMSSEELTLWQAFFILEDEEDNFRSKHDKLLDSMRKR
jgi:hypothetical protein